MPSVVEKTSAGPPPEDGARLALAFALAAASAGAAAWTLARGDGGAGETLRAALVIAWAVASAALARMQPAEPLGMLTVAGAAIGALGSAAAVAAGDPAVADAARLVRTLCIAVLPAAGLHLALGLPDGALGTRGRRGLVAATYAVALGTGLALWAARPASLWPVAVLAAVAVLVGASGSTARYQRARGLRRQRMQWFGWSATIGVGALVVAGALRILIGWPDEAGWVAAVAAIPVPLALVLGGSKRLCASIDRILSHTVSLAGLTAVVLAMYLLIVVGLGRVPVGREQRLLALSMAAAGIAALAYLPARERLARIASRIVYGERPPPEDVLKTFSSRLSRAIPMDELLLQLCESLRKTMGVDVAEVWRGGQGSLERTVSDPERPHATIVLGPKEEPVVARAGVSGPAWIRVWLPRILEGRAGSILRVAPITHSGELLGLIVAERRNPEEPFTEEQERVLTELARQVGLALHNVQLDSALQASLEQLRHQADDLRASRQRIVASADAARRKIERDLHDGAQQRLVALAVKLRLAARVGEQDPAKAREILGEMGGDFDATVQELRDLMHGIYPKVLEDMGLVPALETWAQKATIPTTVEGEANLPRFDQEVETAVYFCCREALQNASKHAGEGASATIRVWREAGGLLFEVADSGKGLDPGALVRGLGFTNMEDRVGAIGGTLTVDGAPGAGTTIRGRIPVG